MYQWPSSLMRLVACRPFRAPKYYLNQCWSVYQLDPQDDTALRPQHFMRLKNGLSDFSLSSISYVFILDLWWTRTSVTRPQNLGIWILCGAWSKITFLGLNLNQSSQRNVFIRWEIRLMDQIPQYIRKISHNAPFCNRNVHTHVQFFVTKWCILVNGAGPLWDFDLLDLLPESLNAPVPYPMMFGCVLG